MRANGLSGLGAKIEQIGRQVIAEYANKIYNEALSNLKGSSLKSSVRLEQIDGGNLWRIGVDNEIAIYVEFGTGEYARMYLAGKPQEMIDEAIKFYVNGKGTMPAQPWLFPVYYKYKDEIPREYDRRVQQLFNKVKL